MQIDLKKYGYYRVASCAPELRISNIKFNTEKIIDAIEIAAENNALFVLFPELAVSGYSCGDIFFSKDLLDSSKESLLKIAKVTKKYSSTAIVGLPYAHKGKIYNSAAFISCGDILGIVPKTYLCNTNEYYEERWFSSDFDRIDDTTNINEIEIPFGADLLFKAKNFDDLTIGIEICEDLWTVKPPSMDQATAGATLICNLSASNEYIGKLDYRRNIVKMQSGRCFAGYLYSSCGVNESTSDTIFSGHLMYAEYGSILNQNKRFSFETDIIYSDVDIDRIVAERLNNNSYGISKPDKTYRFIDFKAKNSVVDNLERNFPKFPFIPENEVEQRTVLEEIINIQAYALLRRLKHIGIENVVIGISGGSDSTLALLSTVKAFDIAGYNRKNIHAVTMPAFATSERTKNNADNLMKYLGVSSYEISIVETIKKHFENIGQDINNHDVVYENAQARERTQILMDLSNKVKGIVIGTGDLTEIALGWSTYNADQMSMYGLNAGIPKTLVKLLIKWYAEKEFTEIRNTLFDIIETPVSPELVPGKKDEMQESEKILGPYEIHDFFLYYFVRYGFKPIKIYMLACLAFGEKYQSKKIKEWLVLFLKRFYQNQFKRSSMPDGIKIGSISLSQRADWRMPSDLDVSDIINRFEEEYKQRKQEQK